MPEGRNLAKRRANREVVKVVEGEREGEFLRFDLGDDYQEAVSFHRWFAMRGTGAARAAVAFTISPDWLRDPEKVALVAVGDDTALAAALAARKAENADPHRENKAQSLLDLCAGVGTIGAMAARLGFDALSLELSNIPHLIGKVLYDFPLSTGAADGRGITGCWRGYTTEVEEFANAVWQGAKVRMNELFEEDVDVRVWVRFALCPFCGATVPVVPNARLSGDAALNIIPDPSATRGSAYPRFGLLRTEFPDLRGTFAKGFCTCSSCGNRFPFQGHGLISLRSVPVAVRMRHSGALCEIDSPDAYVRRVEASSYDFIAASARRLGDRVTLPGGQPVFHDIRGEPIRARDAFLPRQRAYFAALAESMSAETAVLSKRTALTEAQRTAVRVAVALLISGQADYVNTSFHSSIDRPHPSTSAGPLRLGGLFTEVGGFWLERFWRVRLSHLLSLLRVNSSGARPILAIRANADAIPLRDAAVSAVIWDPPYYDNIDYDTVSGHYQSVLAAVIPDLTGEPVYQPRLPSAERIKRHEDDLVRQAREARRVVSPNGNIGVFWLAREPAELKRFLELIGPAALQLVHAVRLDTIRAARATSAEQQTYLLVLQPILVAAPEVPAVDPEKVLSLAAVGALSLYDGIAELFESVLEPQYLDELIDNGASGPARQRLAGFLARQPELEQLLIDHLGRPSLLRELVHRGASREDLRAMDVRGLARRLLRLLGFAVARAVRFSIREALRDCENAGRRLELADSAAAVREAFLTGFNRIEAILRYTVYSWAYLECGDQWEPIFEQVISSSMPSYPGPDRLSFGHLHVLFTKLPATFATNDQEPDSDLFLQISRTLKKAKIGQKLSELVYWRNGVGHEKEYVTSLSVPQLRQKCSTVLAGACTALAEIDRERLLPVTVRPEQERRDRYNRRVLLLLDPNDAAIEVDVGSETDLTEPLVYFAPVNNDGPDLNPKFLRASVVEALSGLNGQDSRPGRA
jgi:hypothetical protein